MTQPPAPPLAGAGPAYGFVQQLGWNPPPTVPRRRWWFWACGGCAAIALVAIAVVAFIFIHIFSSSPLRQFPTQAGATTTEDNFRSVNSTTSETLLIVDPHPLSEVETYYQQALHQNGWTTATHDPSHGASGDTWTIARAASPTQRGSITFTRAGGTTHIAVDFQY